MKFGQGVNGEKVAYFTIQNIYNKNCDKIDEQNELDVWFPEYEWRKKRF